LSEGDPIIVRAVQGARVIVELAATVPTDP
jgi:hypothetical protein